MDDTRFQLNFFLIISIQAKDVSVSFGLKAIDPCDPESSGFTTISATRSTENSIPGHFNMGSVDRLSSLVSINSPFFKVTHNISVEIDYNGINNPAEASHFPRNIPEWGDVY